MKAIVKTVAAALIGFAAAYLLGAFWHATFDITRWGQDARGSLAFLGAIAAWVSAMAVHFPRIGA